MFCDFCHYNDPACKCYIIQNNDSLSCTQCGRVQNNFFGDYNPVHDLTEEICHNDRKLFFLEISQKLNVMDSVGKIAFETFQNLKKNIRRSTKSNNVLIAFCFKIVFADFGIFFPTDRIFKMLDVEISNFVKIQKYFFDKNIRVNILKSVSIESDNIFLVLDVFCPDVRKVLTNQSIRISEITDYKLETICCAVYVCMKVTKEGKKKSKIFLQTCLDRIGVTKNSIKKIILRFYGIKI